MRADSYDVIVVGVGAMGSATCWHLAQRGVRVLGIEQFDIAHERGSSHGHTRMIRLAYYEHPDYVPLLRRAYELWDELEAQSGQKLLHRTGGIYMGPAHGEVVGGAARAAREHGLDHELLDHAQLTQRFPQFSIPPSFAGVWEPEAGFLLVERAIAVMATRALHAGATLHTRETVLDWESHDGGVTVRTSKGQYQARHVIFCGGPWSGKLLGQLRPSLHVTRQVMGWVWPAAPGLFQLGQFPVWGIEAEDGSLSYGFPMLGDFPGLKVARHGKAGLADPDSVSRQITPEDEREVREIIQRHLPQALGPMVSMRVCLYTNSPDGHFIIDQLPGHAGVSVACGFSGHGFKFASVVGEVLADLALQGRCRWPIGFLGASRLGNG